MKDKPFDSSENAPSQFYPARTTSLYEARSSEAPSLMSVILSSLQKYWYVSILLSSLMIAGVAYKTAKQPRIYKSDIQISIDLKNSASFGEKIAATANNAAISADEKATTIETIIQTLQSRSIVQKAVDIIPDPQLKPETDDVLGNLNIQSGKSTDIISISYSDTKPERIVAVLNALGKTYIDYSIKTRKARTDKSIAFVESQLPDSRKRLEDSAQSVEQFRQKYRFFDPESSSKNLAEYRQEITAKLNENRVQQSQTKEQYAELKKQLDKVGLNFNGNLSTTMLTQDGAYQDLFKKLNELELVYGQEKVRFSDSNPIVINAKEKRDQVLALLKNRAQQVLNRNVSSAEVTNGSISNFSNNLAQSLSNKQLELQTNLASQSAQYQSLYKVYEQIEAQLAQLPTLQKQYTELQRQYTIHSQELTAFLQKLQELKIADAEQIVTWSLIDPPLLPEEPISPDVNRQLGLGAIGSLLLGGLAAVGLNKITNRIDDPDIIKSITGLSILTMIPKVKNFNSTFIRDVTITQFDTSLRLSHWGFRDAIRNLALGIGLTSGQRENQAGKVIAITSALPKEGKSTIAFHTCVALGDLGHKVLLVDADLYNSSIAHLCDSSQLFQTFGSTKLSVDAGLSDILLSQDDQWKWLIKECSQTKLDVLLSGSQSINSFLLFNSPKFSRLIEQWRIEYDFVIFDTPSVAGVSDIRLIGSLVDALIFAVSMDMAKKEPIERALDIISGVNTPVLGVVINHLGRKHSDYNKFQQQIVTASAIRSNNKVK